MNAVNLTLEGYRIKMRRQTIAYYIYLKCFNLLLLGYRLLAQFRVVLLFLLPLVANICQANSWNSIEPGIEYQDLNRNSIMPWSHIHVFRVDLAQNQMELAAAQAMFKTSHASIEQFAQKTKPIIALNGGFFDTQFKPMGLRINHQKQLTPLKPISWWGIFHIDQEQKPGLTSMRQFEPDSTLNFALQAGPRLIINGKIPHLKAGYAERSALGITKSGKVIIVVTQNYPMTTRMLAELMRSTPVNCLYALNLDGGSSSQLYVNSNKLKMHSPGFTHISDAVIVKSR